MSVLFQFSAPRLSQIPNIDFTVHEGTRREIVFQCHLPDPSKLAQDVVLIVTWFLDGKQVKTSQVLVKDLPATLKENDWSPNVNKEGHVSLGKNVCIKTSHMEVI